MTDLPVVAITFAEWKKNKKQYDQWGRARNDCLADFQSEVHEMAKDRGWPVNRVLNWIARRTGVSPQCLMNWMERGPTRHPTMRTFPYVMRVAFGITYQRTLSNDEPISLLAARQRLAK